MSYKLTPEERERIGEITDDDFRRFPAPRWNRGKSGRWSVRMVCPDGYIRTMTNRKGTFGWGVWAPEEARIRDNKVGPRLRFDVLSRDGFRCRYCGRTSDETVLHVDHVMPAIEGGPADLDNLVASCRDCNLGKGARLLTASPVADQIQ